MGVLVETGEGLRVFVWVALVSDCPRRCDSGPGLEQGVGLE
jgi:hypothetical protein